MADEEKDDGYASPGSENSDYTDVDPDFYNYLEENGRTYHAFCKGRYLLPNDEKEQNRMDMLNHIFSLVLDNKLCLAPIDPDPQHVLDLGTGTGIWAIDFADNAVQKLIWTIGNDLSPIQPSMVPPNCIFETSDFEDLWPSRKTPFDYIHCREMDGWIYNPQRLFEQAFSNLRPDGWLEMATIELTWHSFDSSHERAKNAISWRNLLEKASKKLGKPFCGVHQWRNEMIVAGFVDVKTVTKKIPLGSWSKSEREVGKWAQAHMLDALEPYSMALLTRVLDWSPTEVQALLGK
ncbi:hypothetical protein AJ80_10027, partial [Polytolypa hystricis UAMH7299]